MPRYKTPEYTRNAQKRYAEKFEHCSCNLPPGTKDRIKAVTDESINQFINRLVLTEIERLESESSDG